jgi:four helix bundle protein
VPLKSHRELIAWQKAMLLVELVIPIARSIGTRPAGLAAQMEKAAMSVPMNIAEGYGRSSRAEYLHFLAIAAGSLRELETQLFIAQRSSLANHEKVTRALELADETGRVLHGLRKSLTPETQKVRRTQGRK